MNAPVSNADELINSSKDWHPNEKGTKFIADALEAVILKMIVDNDIAEIAGQKN